MKYTKVFINSVLDLVGGADNIAILDYCISRVRISVHNNDIINREKIKDIEDFGVKVFIIDSNLIHLVIKPIGTSGEVEKILRDTIEKL